MPIDRKSVLKAVDEAIKNAKKRKFPQKVDLVLSLKDLDLKVPENRLNEIVELPHPSKPNVKITVFAGGDLALRAEKAGVDLVLGRTAIANFQNDKKGAKKMVENTDFFLAETSLMPLVGKALGPILGPRGKMPTPVPPTAAIEALVNRHRASVRVRFREQPNVQVLIGTEEMSREMLTDNIQAVISLLERRLERGFRNIRNAYVKTTMGPLAKIDF